MDEIIDFVRADFLDGTPDVRLDGSTDLLEEQILDSLRIFILVDHLEKTYDINVDGDDLVLENFQTAQRIATLVESKK